MSEDFDAVFMANLGVLLAFSPMTPLVFPKHADSSLLSSQLLKPPEKRYKETVPSFATLPQLCPCNLEHRAEGNHPLLWLCSLMRITLQGYALGDQILLLWKLPRLPVTAPWAPRTNGNWCKSHTTSYFHSHRCLSQALRIINLTSLRGSL